MKATGIVRRIDYPVIIRQSQETQINQWFSLILSKENLLEIIISWDSEKVNKDTLITGGCAYETGCFSLRSAV